MFRLNATNRLCERVRNSLWKKYTLKKSGHFSSVKKVQKYNLYNLIKYKALLNAIKYYNCKKKIILYIKL